MVNCRSCSAIDLEAAFSSNRLVQDVECSISGSNSSPCNECKELDNLEIFLARMEMKGFELKRNVNRAHSPLIRMVPAEIIAKISEFANTNPTILGKVLPTPILLSSICSDWRRVVVGTPQIWSSMRIDFYFLKSLHITSTTFPLLAAFIDEWLSRSGQLPLHISIFSGDKIPNFMSLEEFCIIFKVLNDYSSRWHCLNISFTPFILSCLQPDRLPLLEQLNIELPYRLPKAEYKLIFPPSPRLKAVEILGDQLTPLRDIGIKWDIVTHLSGVLMTIHDCFGFLRLLPKLIHCKFHKIKLDIDGPLLESPILSRLTHLSLSCYPMSPGPFLDNIVLPSLKTLVLFHVVSLDPLLAFLERSACSLHTLSLQFSNIGNVDNFTQLLRFLSPTLTKLVIVPTLPNVEYLSVLTKTYISQSTAVPNDFLPHLEIFGYRYCSDTLDPATSFDLPVLRMRNPKTTIAPISLRSAYIDVGRIIHEPISQDILSILQRINEDGILNTPSTSPLNGLLIGKCTDQAHIPVEHPYPVS